MSLLRHLPGVTARIVFLAFAFSMAMSGEVAAQPLCSPPNLVDVTFNAGTRWQFCWEIRQREGLVINRAFYTDRGGTEREVLSRASVAQIHVPYHPGSPRFRDLTVSTSGLGQNAVNLTAAECSPGTLLTPRVCSEIEHRGLAWKFISLFQKGEQVTVWISSQLGQYNYLTMWRFLDDGTIDAELGLTGRLQILRTGAGYAPFGSRVNAENGATPVYGVSHMHSVYYRFDFDVGGPENDAVDGLYAYQYLGPPPSPVSLCDQYGQCSANDRYRFTNETYDLRWAPFWSWRVQDNAILNQDGRSIGYEIVPISNAHWDGMTQTTEPWSVGDVYVTTYNGCELLATDNRPPFIPPECAGSRTDVLDMTSEGDPVDGADVVVWYVSQFIHVPRDEDQSNMPTDHSGVRLLPRSWRHKNTLEP